MKGWWWNWKSGSGWPAGASSDPPEYQTQLIFLAERRSPMVANVLEPVEPGHDGVAADRAARESVSVW